MYAARIAAGVVKGSQQARTRSQEVALQARARVNAAVEAGKWVPEPQTVEEIDIPFDEILDTIAQEWFSKYALLPSKAAETFLTLWAAHTWYREEDGGLAFRVTPRAWILSKEFGSAKSLVLELLALMSYNVQSIEIEPTGPFMKMSIGREHATQMLDEGDILFGAGQRKQEVRAIINAGYSRLGFGGTVSTGIGGSPNRIKVFGPVAVAGLDVMETGTDDYLKAMLSRGVRIRMNKASPKAIALLPKLEVDMVMGTAEEEALCGRQALAWMSGQTWDDVISDQSVAKAAYLLLPPELDSRAAQIWNPLARIALVAGGAWPDRTRNAARILSGGRGTQAPGNFTSTFRRNNG